MTDWVGLALQDFMESEDTPALSTSTLPSAPANPTVTSALSAAPLKSSLKKAYIHLAEAGTRCGHASEHASSQAELLARFAATNPLHVDTCCTRCATELLHARQHL